MTYEITRHEFVGGEVNGVPFNVKRYYITFYGREPKDDDPYLSVWADGSLSAIWKEQSIFLYDDQWDGMIKAIQQAKADKKAEREAFSAKWLIENGDKIEHEGGAKVSISINETKRILASSEIRRRDDGVVEINHCGEWLRLCRTDLMDDVCTINSLQRSTGIEELRDFYLGKIAYGARIEHGHFAVVDSYSDG